MFEICVLKEETREGTRRAKGKTLTTRWGLCLDSMNIVLAIDTGYGYSGSLYPHKFANLAKPLQELGVSENQAVGLIARGLSDLLNVELSREPKSLSELDVIFKTTKRVADSTGMLQLYKLVSEQQKDVLCGSRPTAS